MHKQENTPVADELKNLSPDMFAPATESSMVDNEKIAAPSLSFIQDSWRRLKKIKQLLLVCLF